MTDSPDSSSGSSFPAIILMKVVLPVPFSPNNTRISESENWPASTSKLQERRRRENDDQGKAI